MNIYLTSPVAFILYLNIIIDGIQSNNSNDGNNPVTPDPVLSKISKKLLLVYPQLEHHKDSPLYEVAMRQLESLAKHVVNLEDELGDDQLKLEKIAQQMGFEKRDKLTYMSLLDMTDVAKNFIEECYPPWMPSYNPQLEEKNLRFVLLNIENPRVLRLKRILIKNNVPESEFIKELMRYTSQRNDKAILQLSPEERKRTYEKFGEKYESDSDKVILEFLLGDKPDLSPAASSISTSSPEMSEDAIRRAVNKMRADFRLVEIPDYVEETDDILLTKDIETFYEAYGSSIQKSVTEPNYKPVVIFVVKGLKHAYILFDNFQGAYALWDRRFYVQIPDKFRKGMFLKNVTEEAPFEGGLYLKIEIEKAIFDDSKTKILKGHDNRTPHCKTDSNAVITKSATLFCKFNSFEDALLVYKYWKKEFKTQIEATQITFSAEHGNNDIKKMPVLKEVQAGITKL